MLTINNLNNQYLLGALSILIYYRKIVLTPLFLLSSYNSTTALNLAFGLQNTLSNIHPPLLIYTWILFILKPHSKIPLVSIAITLLLGSWWAFQEVLWGGLWNWDNIECSLLALTIILLLQAHTQKQTPGWYINWIPFIFLLNIFNKNPLYTSIHSFTSNSYISVNIPVILCLVLFSTRYFLITTTLFFLTILPLAFVKWTVILKYLTVSFFIYNLLIYSSLTLQFIYFLFLLPIPLIIATLMILLMIIFKSQFV